MPPRVVFIRLRDFSLHDPPLTTLGEEQCAALQTHLRSSGWADEIDLIIASPMRRTLQTTKLSLGWLIERGVPVLGLAEAQGASLGQFIDLRPVLLDILWRNLTRRAQEYSEKPCDTGSPLKEMQSAFPFCDYSTVHSAWPSKQGEFAKTREAINQRCCAVRAFLNERPEKLIAVVTHSAILRIGIVQKLFANGDYRIFDFVEGESKGDDHPVVESDLTRGMGGMRMSSDGPGGERPRDFKDGQCPEPAT